MIIFEILLLIIMRAEINSIKNMILLISFFTLTFLIYRISLCMFMAKDCCDKNVNAKTTWIILSIIFGILILPIYFINQIAVHQTKNTNQKMF